MSVTMIKAFLLFSLFLLSECCSPFVDNSIDGASNSLQGVLGNTILVEEPVRSEYIGTIKKSEELLCTNFNNCRWRNDNDQAMKWYRTKGNVDILRLQAITGTNIPPRSPFAIAATPNAKVPSDGAHLISDTVPCQDNTGEIRFKYWITPSVQVSVCVRLIGNKEFSYCSLPLYSGSPGPAFVKVRGPIQQPFEIVIVVNHFTYNDGTYAGGLAIIDDLEYNGQLCSAFIDNRELLIGKTDEKLKEKLISVESNEKACMLLKCDFSDGLCPHYRPSSNWQLAKGPIGNPVTGIRGDASAIPYNNSGEYLFVEGTIPQATFETLQITIFSPVLLKFAYYAAAVDATFRVLSKKFDDDNFELIFESPKAHINSRQWFNEKQILHPANYEKIVFVANDVKPHIYIGLDEISLLSVDGLPLC